MKALLTLAAFAAICGGSLAQAEPGGFWANRPNVIRAADVLAEEVEHFDTSLHNISAPQHVIAKVHHFEETVTEFVNEVRAGMSYQEATQEMNHIRQDVGLIRDELYAHPQLLQNPIVNREWRHMRTAYRNLDHQMFLWNSARWTPERVQELERDMAELEAAH